MPTTKVYGKFLESMADKLIDLNSDTLKVMLVTSAYTPDQDTHQFKSSVTNEVSGTGYTAGGATLGTVNVAYTAGTNTLMFDAADTSWTSSTITNARYAIIYDSTPATDATRPLIAYVDLDSDRSTTNSEFKLTWNSSGIITWAVP